MPNWITRRVLDLVGTSTDLYYRHKYGTLARHLGRPSVPADDKPGFILIQIDGLSYRHFAEAVDRGVMPHVSRLLKSGELSVAPWRCGIPSSTLSVQAGMMFGNRFDIPGFRWYEKDRGIAMTPHRLDQIRIMRERISQTEPGILHGGSCYVSILDGDADLALFTLSTLGRHRFFESMRGVGLLVLFFLNPFRALRVMGHSLADYALRLARRMRALTRTFRQRMRSRVLGATSDERAPVSIKHRISVLLPLVQAISKALFVEVQTFGVMVDIYRRVPAIYTVYNAYDEVAHELGPTHPIAFKVLRRIDRRIRQIDRMRLNYEEREYDLYLMSDHGNTSAIPFSWQNDTSLGQHVVRQIGKGTSLEEDIDQHTSVHNRARYLREELRALERSAAPPLRSMLASARRYVSRHVEDLQAPNYDVTRQEDVVVSASGPLAHIYFNVSPRPLDLVEVLLLYPHVLSELATTKGIGAIIGRRGERTVILNAEGGHWKSAVVRSL